MQTQAPTLRVACRHHDWTDALLDGRVKPKSFPIQATTQANVGAESLIGDAPKFDYAECGLTGLIRARARGAPVLALPTFIRNTFRHSYMFINTGAGIKSPRDLEGKRVGTRYNMTATVWARALLQHDYGVKMEAIHWLDQAGPDDGPYYLPPGLTLEPVDKDVEMMDWLREGRIDALIHAEADGYKVLGDSRVSRLFPNAHHDEQEWWKQNHMVPMMNVVACPEDAVKNRRAEVQEVFDAFCEAKRTGQRLLLNNRTSGLMWYWDALEDQLAVMGEDPVPYSVAKNRHAIDRLLTYCAEQGIVDRKLAVEELFATGFES